MSRSFERKLIYVASGWQLITGFITIFFYSFYVKDQANHIGHLSPVESMGVHSIFNNLYTFTITYGLFFVVIACLNTLFTWRMVKNNSIQHKLPIVWMGLAVLFYFLSDFISVMLYLAAAVIALAKNRALKILILSGEGQQ